MKATLGRIVHYYRSEESGWCAAIVTGERPGENDAIELQCFGFCANEIYSAREGVAVGCWRWPPRVVEEKK